MIRRGIVACGVVLVVLGTTLSAHHSPVLFDRSKRVTLSGTVVAFAWMHPHASIQLDVANTAGGFDRWAIEMNSPNNLMKEGWKPTLIKTGDKVTIVVNPLRSGEHCGVFVSIKLPGGEVLGETSLDGIDSKIVSRR
jgi:hypothetical protein